MTSKTIRHTLIALLSFSFVLFFSTFTVCEGVTLYTITVKVVEEGTSTAIPGAKWKLKDETVWRENDSSIRVKKNATVTVHFDVPDAYVAMNDQDITAKESVSRIFEAHLSSTGQPGVLQQRISDWPLWPTKPSSPYDSILFEPLSFTIVGSERNYLSWSENIPGSSGSVWGGKIYLSDLNASTTYTTESTSVFSTRSLNFWRGIEEATFSLKSLSRDDIGVLPEYIEEWVLVSDDMVQVWVSNQDIIFDDVNSFVEDWEFFLEGRTKGDDSSHIGDTGHASPTMVYVDNIWIANLPGYRAYRKFLTNAYQTGGWGDGILLVPTNEGILHGFSLEPFVEKWGVMPFTVQALGYYQEARRILTGLLTESWTMPRMNLLDGPLGFADVASDTDGAWRRIVVGTSGTGLTLENKPSVFFEEEYSRLNRPETLGANLISQYAAKTRNNPHFWGIYAVNLADNGTDQVLPTAPELLWSVSSVYFEEDSTAKGAVFVNGARYERNNDGTRDEGEVSDSYKGYQDIRLSCARPVIGMTVDNNGNKKWHVLLVGITHDGHFRLYDLDPDTGEILENIDLGNYPTLYRDGAGTVLNNSLTDLSSTIGGSFGDICWDERFEWKFPTRIGAIAKDQVRDQNPDDLTQVRLYKDPLLKEVYVHLSNGALYRWDVSQPPSTTNPEMVALSIYDYTYTDADTGEEFSIVSGPSTQDFDGTYLPVDDEYHRFLALVLKGGKEPKGDLRGLASIDVDRILASDKVFVINAENAWGHGNKDRVDAFEDDMGWFVLLAGGDASEGKFWNEVLTVSAPVFIDGRIVLAGYQPDTGTSWVYNIDAQPEDQAVIVDDQTAYENTEFVGGATINNSGPDGQAVIFVGTDTGVAASQDIEGVQWDTGVGSGTSGSDAMQIVYWKTNN